MKPSVLLLLLLAADCASKDGFIDERVFDCEAGQLVTVQAGLDVPGARMEGMDDQHTLVVTVGNNGPQEITVKAIRADQMPDALARYRFNSGYRNFDQVIPEGDDAEFRIPMAGRPVQPEVDSTGRSHQNVQFDVLVLLANGDQYRCRFEIPMR